MSAERDAGFAALQQGDLATAIPTLERAAQADPTDYQAHLYLGAAYGQAERHTEAVTTMTNAVEIQPANAQARYNLGVSYERAGWNAEAATAMQQALQLQPNYPQAQEALARLQSAPPLAPQLIPQPLTAPAPSGYAPPTQQAPPGYAPTPTPSPYGQPAPPSGAASQSQTPYGQQAPPSPYGGPYPPPPSGAPNAPYGSYAPQAYKPAPASAPNVAVGLLVSIGLVLLGGIGAGYFTYVTGISIPVASIIFGFLFGWIIPKVSGGKGQAQGIIAAAGAGFATLATVGVAYALGGLVSPVSFILVFYAINRGYKLASGN